MRNPPLSHKAPPPTPSAVKLVDDVGLPTGIAIAATQVDGSLTLIGYRHHRDLCALRQVELRGRKPERLVREFADALHGGAVAAGPGPHLESFLCQTGLKHRAATDLARRLRRRAEGVDHD